MAEEQIIIGEWQGYNCEQETLFSHARNPDIQTLLISKAGNKAQEMLQSEQYLNAAVR